MLWGFFMPKRLKIIKNASTKLFYRDEGSEETVQSVYLAVKVN